MKPEPSHRVDSNASRCYLPRKQQFLASLIKIRESAHTLRVNPTFRNTFWRKKVLAKEEAVCLKMGSPGGIPPQSLSATPSLTTTASPCRPAPHPPHVSALLLSGQLDSRHWLLRVPRTGLLGQPPNRALPRPGGSTTSPQPSYTSLSRVRLCNPMDCTVHGIFQARMLEWVALPFSSRSS